ncbi:MAG TPA: OpgC domain-containing protein [Alphaproteobacteria bacterium]|nr:OpgC domain-containing protein [Alphaproteobacteria bacterium]
MRRTWSFKRLFSVDPADLAPSAQRDLRLDFFRGLALIFIFLDHIPSNVVNNWLTVRNYGFSDAAEIFIFISGYSAAIAYGGTMRRAGFPLAAAQILRRCWQLYVAHIFIFMIFTAQIAYVAARFNNPLFAEEMQIIELVNDPQSTLVQGLLLKFRPVNLDILPLYIVLLLVFPVVLWALERWPAWVIAISAFLYGFTQATHINFPGYPPGEVWFFNPFAWQFLFVIGALLGRVHGSPQPAVPPRPWLLAVAGAYLLFALAVVLSWHLPRLQGHFPPPWLGAILYPINKTNLDPLRLSHFLALAYVTVTLVRPHTAFLRWRVCRPILRCGQQSLYVFCVGILLSFTSHFFLVEVDDSLGMQVLVSAAGVAIMIGLAYLIAWYRRASQTAAAARQGRAQMAGGE